MKRDLKKYIFKRILLSFLVLIGVSIISFSLVHLTPGDPVRLMLPEGVSQERMDNMREQLGLNKPIYIQYLEYMNGILHGDFGTSLYFKKPNLELILDSLGNTFILGFVAISGALLISIPLGVVAGIKQGSFIDLFAILFALSGQAMSPVWLGILLIYIFSTKLQLLPVFGYGSVKGLILPAITIGWQLAALITRVTRAGIIEVLSEDYILAIRAKGILETKVLYRYALKNVLISIITIVGVQFAALMGGSVVTENIFSWPGIGRLVITAIYGRDFPLIQSAVLTIAMFFVGVNLVVDVMYSFIDPRMRY
jgi:peptide/nickel transport system permease protein